MSVSLWVPESLNLKILELLTQLKITKIKEWHTYKLTKLSDTLNSWAVNCSYKCMPSYLQLCSTTLSCVCWVSSMCSFVVLSFRHTSVLQTLPTTGLQNSTILQAVQYYTNSTLQYHTEFSTKLKLLIWSLKLFFCDIFIFNLNNLKILIDLLCLNRNKKNFEEPNIQVTFNKCQTN